MGTGWQLTLVLVLVSINAVLAGSEIALVSLREGQLRRLAERRGSGRIAAQLAADPNRFLATIQIGITLAGFLAAATAAVTLAEPLTARLGFMERAARPVAVVSVTLLLTFLTLVLGELAPKRVAMQRAERWSLLVARPLSGLATVARPAVWALGRATDLVVRLAGADPSKGREAVSGEEIRDLVATAGLYSKDQRQIILGALEATSRTLRQVLQPRSLVVAFRADTAVSEARRKLVEIGRTRAPVFEEQIDDADRVVSILDLVDATGLVGDHAHEAIALPEAASLIDGMREMQAQRQWMALVVSEYGGVEGLVTVEDLIEELVGEIHDEYDRDVRQAVHNPDGSITVVGHFPVHDLTDLDVELPPGDYVTVAGLVQDRLGRLAVEGDRVELEGWRLQVLSVKGRAVERVRLEPQDTPAPD